MKQLSQIHTAREQRLNSLNSGFLLACFLLLDKTLTKATSGGMGLFGLQFQVTILRDQDRNEGKVLRAACLLVHIALLLTKGLTSQPKTHTRNRGGCCLRGGFQANLYSATFLIQLRTTYLGMVSPTSGLGPLLPVNNEDIRHAHRPIICSRQLLS